ncbi:hypothetical protein Gotur_018274 [Gossypium turneri]
MVGKVAKLDFNNSNKARGIFAWEYGSQIRFNALVNINEKEGIQVKRSNGNSANFCGEDRVARPLSGKKDGVGQSSIRASWGVCFFPFSREKPFEFRTVTVAVTSHTAAFKSNSSSHFNTMYEELLEVSVKLKEGVLNHSNHSAVTFKENMHPNPGSVMGVAQQNFLGREGVAADLRIDGEKVGGGHRGRKLSKTIRDRGNLFKSSTSRIPSPDSVNNLVEFITSQIEKETAQEGPKKAGK